MTRALPEHLQRHKTSRYVTDEFYRGLALKQGLSPEQVRLRATRRIKATIKLGVYYPELLGLDNPFIESHAWKFLVRESIRDQNRAKMYGFQPGNSYGKTTIQ
jgi:hypothetical protein